jgi:hypothetical protein
MRSILLSLAIGLSFGWYGAAGYAWSDPGPKSRTFAQINLELHDALTSATDTSGESQEDWARSGHAGQDVLMDLAAWIDGKRVIVDPGGHRMNVNRGERGRLWRGPRLKSTWKRFA